MMMGAKCFRSVAAKLRTDLMAMPLGVRMEPGVGVLGESSLVRSVNRTRLLVVVIVLDAFSDVIFLSLDLSSERQ